MYITYGKTGMATEECSNTFLLKSKDAFFIIYSKLIFFDTNILNNKEIWYDNFCYDTVRARKLWNMKTTWKQ